MPISPEKFAEYHLTVDIIKYFSVIHRTQPSRPFRWLTIVSWYGRDKVGVEEQRATMRTVRDMLKQHDCNHALLCRTNREVCLLSERPLDEFRLMVKLEHGLSFSHSIEYDANFGIHKDLEVIVGPIDHPTFVFMGEGTI